MHLVDNVQPKFLKLPFRGDGVEYTKLDIRRLANNAS